MCHDHLIISSKSTHQSWPSYDLSVRRKRDILFLHVLLVHGMYFPTTSPSLYSHSPSPSQFPSPRTSVSLPETVVLSRVPNPCHVHHRRTRVSSVWLSTPTRGSPCTPHDAPSSTVASVVRRCHPTSSPFPTVPTSTCWPTTRINLCWLRKFLQNIKKPSKNSKVKNTWFINAPKIDKESTKYWSGALFFSKFCHGAQNVCYPICTKQRPISPTAESLVPERLRTRRR